MNILIKLMSIVSLVIAPTLAAMYGKAGSNHSKQEMIKEFTITKTDSNNKTMTITADGDALKVPTEKLIEALVADKLIEKDNFSLALSKGKLILNDTEVTSEVAAKYKVLIDALGGADLKIKNNQK